jgi:antitoxin (DNA-binding transcriptional repressor) of toxin-antitoxin stability system
LSQRTPRKGRLAVRRSISLEEAQAKLPESIGKLGPGEEVVITKDGQPVVELRSIAAGKPQPRFGSCQGIPTVVAEDEEHLGDFKEYMP